METNPAFNGFSGQVQNKKKKKKKKEERKGVKREERTAAEGLKAGRVGRELLPRLAGPPGRLAGLLQPALARLPPKLCSAPRPPYHTASRSPIPAVVCTS